MKIDVLVSDPWEFDDTYGGNKVRLEGHLDGTLTVADVKVVSGWGQVGTARIRCRYRGEIFQDLLEGGELEVNLSRDTDSGKEGLIGLAKIVSS